MNQSNPALEIDNEVSPEIEQIAEALCDFDGLCLDNQPERLMLAQWIAENFIRKVLEG